jgi:hypothetical protein
MSSSLAIGVHFVFPNRISASLSFTARCNSYKSRPFNISPSVTDFAFCKNVLLAVLLETTIPSPPEHYDSKLIPLHGFTGPLSRVSILALEMLSNNSKLEEKERLEKIGKFILYYPLFKSNISPR